MSDDERVKIIEMIKTRGREIGNRMALSYDQVGPRFFSHLGKRLVELAEIPQGASVLDIATGRGAILFPAAEAVGANGYVLGIDLSSEMINQTNLEIQRRNLKQAEVREMDADLLDFPENSFDIVTCGFAIFFLMNINETFGKIRQILKKNGELVVSTWGHDDERWAWMGELFDSYRPPNMPNMPVGRNDFRTVEGMRELMTRAGFEQVRVISEEPEFAYADEEAWLAVQWSQGNRFRLEMMPPDIFEKFKAEAFERIQVNKGPNGFHQLLPTLFTIGIKA